MVRQRAGHPAGGVRVAAALRHVWPWHLLCRLPAEVRPVRKEGGAGADVAAQPAAAVAPRRGLALPAPGAAPDADDAGVRGLPRQVLDLAPREGREPLGGPEVRLADEGARRRRLQLGVRSGRPVRRGARPGVRRVRALPGYPEVCHRVYGQAYPGFLSPGGMSDRIHRHPFPGGRGCLGICLKPAFSRSLLGSEWPSLAALRGNLSCHEQLAAHCTDRVVCCCCEHPWA
mmetsp:Transcript_76211/g.202378  ORF Transcript_76211/g.202378 Transcript_76211/m.202378 type:complete len:230 (+) Transcript_76211:371-1060(+)